ncbi:MAG: lipopolysaccharide biosynthesis protein [Dethiosulfatibacter sp.]|nr:lipopolysaccharide biosynthesis protein [Dethiosulfatibacter sp.]
MSDSIIKNKAISGMFHSFIGLFANNGITFIVGMILARLLEPSDYGLLGMVTVFIAVSGIFVDSGMTTALIREKDVTNEEYSTVFYYNLAVSLVVYILLFLIAGMVSRFFNEPLLVPIIRVVGLGIIVGAFGNIQRTRLTKELNFKLQTKIDIISAVLSSIVGIYLAFIEKGVWALVIMGLFRSIIVSFLLMLSNRWTPLLVFDTRAFKRFFNFGYKMLITGLLATLYHNVYNMIIGKTYSADVLGYYTKSKSLKDMVSMSVLGTVSKVGYPLLSSLQDDKERFSNGFKKIIRHVSYLTFPIFFGMMAVSEPLITLLFGQKWIPMIPFFRVLCLSAIVFPHSALNLNVLQVVGRSDLFLKIDVINMAIGACLISLSMVLNLGINGLLGMIVLLSLIALITNSYYSEQYIGYSTLEQIKDLFVHLLSSLIMGIVVYIFTILLPFHSLINLTISIAIGVVVYIILSLVFKIAEFWSIANITVEMYKRVVNKNVL